MGKRAQGRMCVLILVVESLCCLSQDLSVIDKMKTPPAQSKRSLDLTTPLRLPGARWSSRVAGSATQTIDGVDVTPLISRNQISLSPSYYRTRVLQESGGDAAVFEAADNQTPGGQSALVVLPALSWRFQPYFGWEGSGSEQSLGFGYLGGSTGGPLLKKQLLLFTDVMFREVGTRRSLQGFVPSEAPKLKAHSIHPELNDMLASWPAGKASSGNIAPIMAMYSTLNREVMGALRLDWSGKRSHIYGGVRGSRGTQSQPYSVGLGYAGDVQNSQARLGMAVLDWSLSGQRVSNELHLGATQENYTMRWWSAWDSPYTVFVSGLTGLVGNRWNMRTGRTFALDESWSLRHRTTTFDAGGQVQWLQLNIEDSKSGTFAYYSIDSFFKNRAGTVSVVPEIPQANLHAWRWAAWVQGTAKFPRLLVTAGLRAQVYGQLSAEEGQATPFDLNTCNGFCNSGDAFNLWTPTHLEPRLSAAFMLHQTRKSALVLRMGGGVYHAPGLLLEQATPVFNEKPNYFLLWSKQLPLSYPVEPFLGSAGTLSPRAVDRQRRDATAYQWGASLEQEWLGRWQVVASYLGARGESLPTVNYTNLIDPEIGRRPRTEFGMIRLTANQNNSAFHAVNVNARWTTYKGSWLYGTYTWSKESDDGAAGDISAVAPQNPACIACEWAPGDMDVRHVAVVSYLLPLPAPLKANWIRRGFQGWSFLGAFAMRSSLPLNVVYDRGQVPTGYTIRQRPDYVSARRVTPPNGQSVTRWLDPKAFAPASGEYGTTPRNIARGPARWGWNMSLGKDITVPHVPKAGSVKLRLRLDVWNALNHANYNAPVTNWSSPAFGQIVNPYPASCSGTFGGRCISGGVELR